ncbi:MAG: hypothetical protein J2P45_22255 [Candidatus Dormibacteraeota bacterium]|nr:hypothetical protein [Candidatus Dormibacteraeota bacterium]
MLDRAASFTARAVLTWLSRRFAGRAREWIDGMSQELDAITGGWRQLAWALGGLRFAAVLQWRSWPGHPVRKLLMLLLGVPEHAFEPPSEDGDHDPGSIAFLLTLLCAACTAGAVLVFFRLLEDSPYSFNLGGSARAGIHPDVTNGLSLAWDLVVLGSLAELCAVIAAGVCFLLLACAQGKRRARAAARRLSATLSVAAILLWFVLGATSLWGAIAQGTASTLFDSTQGGAFLNRDSWLITIGIMAASAALASGATARSILKLRA